MKDIEKEKKVFKGKNKNKKISLIINRRFKYSLNLCFKGRYEEGMLKGKIIVPGLIFSAIFAGICMSFFLLFSIVFIYEMLKGNTENEILGIIVILFFWCYTILIISHSIHQSKKDFQILEDKIKKIFQRK